MHPVTLARWPRLTRPTTSLIFSNQDVGARLKAGQRDKGRGTTMAHWLLKSEPAKYSWDQMVKDKRTHWDGVRNFQAANNLKSMKAGDRAFFYHSNEGKEIV